MPKSAPHLPFLDEPKVAISPKEYQRILDLLKTVPGPTAWYVGTYPPVNGPSGLTLEWTRSGGWGYPVRLTPRGRTSPSFLDLGTYVYPMRLLEDRLLVWRHVGKSRSGSPRVMRLTLVDTTSLSTLGWFPERDKDDPVSLEGGALASTDLPSEWKAGVHPFESPSEFSKIPEVWLLVDDTASPGGPFESVYRFQPREGRVEVFPLTWWNDGSFDFGYQWITKVVRDPSTELIVGEGIRLAPFQMDASCRFLRWIYPSNDPPRPR